MSSDRIILDTDPFKTSLAQKVFIIICDTGADQVRRRKMGSSTQSNVDPLKKDLPIAGRSEDAVALAYQPFVEILPLEHPVKREHGDEEHGAL